MTIFTHAMAYLAGCATLPILLYLIVWWDECRDSPAPYDGDI